MGFNNGYDSGWDDAIAAVRAGRVPGLGVEKTPASGGGSSAPARPTITLSPPAGGDDTYDFEDVQIDGVSKDEVLGILLFLKQTSVYIPQGFFTPKEDSYPVIFECGHLSSDGAYGFAVVTKDGVMSNIVDAEFDFVLQE